ncbi:MAG: ATP citrate lyase citrate-binding domain-containing protein [Candidatus Azambacteria bacterium]|nr:ATP citrate lyase citrate-binding domain-containing protein [Candidatus Azambacteria bacterium]
MTLYEFEGKKILEAGGITVPKSQLIKSDDIFSGAGLSFPLVLKAQVLSGKRKDAGGIIFVAEIEEAKRAVLKMFGAKINGEKAESILVEEKIGYSGPEYYISISYDTERRAPVLVFSKEGGTGIEGRGANVFPIDLKNPLERVPVLANLPEELVKKIIKLFFDSDCLLLEINPLVETGGGFVALDAKIKLDDAAFGRHKEWSFPPRSVAGRVPTENEIAAKKIDEGDYRGTAGSAYFDLSGDIAVLASGGGGSLTALDALFVAGGNAANYTEYSGNPPKEKIEKLAKIVMSKPKLNGLWIVGAIANFTDIYATLSGLMDGLRKAEKELGKKFDFPIVIRRGGPRDKEAFEMLRAIKDLDLHLYGEETSIAESAKIITKLSEEYAKKHELTA